MEYAAYTVQGDHVILYRLYGTGPVVEVPDRIEGKRVEILADHLFANEMSVLCDPKQMSLARLRGNSWEVQNGEALLALLRDAENGTPAGMPELSVEDVPVRIMKTLEKEALCADRVSVVHIPEGVRQIGNYAFYGLYQLREVSFPSTIQKIGWGMFNGCRKVNRLMLELKETQELTPPAMKELLDALPNELDVIVRRGADELYRLRFPAYYEEGKENTPARIIEIIYHGTGHQYRNCFLNRVLQFDRYDEVFPLAAAQENPQTNVHLILNRFRSGPAPKKEIQQRYLEYLRQENTVLMEEILSDPDFSPESELRLLDGLDFFTSTLIDASIQAASRKENTRAVSCLMEIRGRRFAGGSAGKSRSRYVL